MPGIDSDTKLLLHLDGADEAQETTDASDSNHEITFVGTAQLDTAVKKWGTASLLLDGDSDYLSAADSADWDIFGSLLDDWTIDLWVKHDDHVGFEVYACQYEDANNIWVLEHYHGQGITLYLLTGGNVYYPARAGEITDTDEHHVAWIKVTDEYAIYLDGTQVSYLKDSDHSDTLTGSLYIGAHGAGVSYMDGHMDEIRIQHNNYFGAAPVVGLTDTITVPPSSYARDLSIDVHDCTNLKEKMGG